MLNMTAAQFAEKHIRRTKAALEDMRAGVNAVTVSPTIKAAAKVDKMRSRLMEALDSGKWAAGLKRVTLDMWKDKMIKLGINRVSQGLDENKAKIEAFAADLLPYIDNGLNKINSMPDVTIEDSIQRMSAFTRYMADFKRKS